MFLCPDAALEWAIGFNLLGKISYNFYTANFDTKEKQKHANIDCLQILVLH